MNYITKFFFGRKSYRQRVFQGPLTLGLQSPSLRRQLLPPCLRQPFHTRAQSYHRAKPRTCCFASFCPRRLQPTFALRGCARRFSCSGTRAQFYYRANRAPAVLHPSVRVGYNRRFHSAGALAGFPARIPARNHITALNRAPVVFASFCPRRLQPTFAFRGCARRFSCSGTPTQSYHRAKPRTCCFASFCPRRLQPTFAFRGCARRFSCSGTRAQSYHRANRAPVTFASFCLRRLQPTFATRLHQQ